jgi:hypothetical protein
MKPHERMHHLGTLALAMLLIMMSMVLEKSEKGTVKGMKETLEKNGGDDECEEESDVDI